HRALMRALALDDQRNAALHQFQTCCRILNEELGVEPAEETVALYEAIQVGEWVGKETSRQVDQATGRLGGIDKGVGVYGPFSLVYGSQSPHLLGSPESPVVARESQLDQLERSLAPALAGAGHVVFVTGEAGSGKTALLGEFARRAMQTHAGLLVASGACDAATGIGDPYLPFREILQLLTGDIESKRASAGLSAEHARRLWAAFPDAIQALVAQGPDLIDTFVPGARLELRADAYARQSGQSAWHARLAQLLRPATGGGKDVRQSLQLTDIFEQVTYVLQAIARQHPLLLVLDDLQWADAGSISLLFHLGRRLVTSRILVAAAYRPDAIAPPSERERHPLHLVVNELVRISGQQPIDLDACKGRTFIEALLGAEPNRLGAVFREQLLRHTEGHPLFTVELLRGMEERGELVRDAQGRWTEGPGLHWDRLPARVEAAIGERIGRLPEHCRALLTAASIEGEEFTAEVVAHALDANEAAVVQCLSSDLGERHRLVIPVSLRRLGAHRISRYRFRHHLFQHYLYCHVDTIRRASLHEAVGSALEVLHDDASDELEALAPRLAWHFEMAGLPDRSAAYYLRAGKEATAVGAHREAIDHLTRGLFLLEALPDAPARTRVKLDLQLAMAYPISYALGFWAPERIQALERAYEISQHPAFAGSDDRWVVSAAFAYFALWSAETERALTIGEDLLQQAERNQEPQQLQWAYSLLGCAHLMRADLILACENLDRALAYGDYRNHQQPDPMIVGVHMGILTLAWQSFALWQCGYPDRAYRGLQQALKAAQDSGYSLTLGLVRAVASVVFFLCARDPARAWQQVQALRQSSDIGLAFEALADSLAGPDTMGGAPDGQVLHQMLHGLATFQAFGSGLGRASQLLLLARGYAHMDQVQAGLDTLDEALRWMNATGACMLEAEAYRLKGELLLIDQSLTDDVTANQTAAEACFQRAIALARQRGARWWELRSTVSLCRLLQEQKVPHDVRRAEARQMLAEIYGWFDEGFDTLDLREARETLDAMEKGNTTTNEEQRIDAHFIRCPPSAVPHPL
ncbi:MAG TPA: AAA family ATPase, partial [Anaerolineae bacterium]|nr:AAA family ATPase [Anaerolineae bacterium]